jgi:hypothetical protein
MSNVKSDLQGVLAANDAFYRAFATFDKEAMEDVWSSSEQVTCIHPGWTLVQGYDDVLASWARILKNPNQPPIVSGGAQVQQYGDCAVVLCRESVAGGLLYATNVFTKESGLWRLVHHQSAPVAVS